VDKLFHPDKYPSTTHHHHKKHDKPEQKKCVN
jgi:hypothetical protein